MKDYDAILASEAETAKTLVAGLLARTAAPFDSVNSIPATGGVYLIYDGAGGILYVGKCTNLRRRICTDHLSAESRDTMSAFRRSVNRVHAVPHGQSMRDWIIASCRFAFLEIDDADLRGLVEMLLIRVVRTPTLLNAH
jgi:hypothetical protein